MPEQIAKYPDMTLRELKGAGAVCGEGATQKILTQCPAARFCASTGEICVYAINEISNMTQINAREIAAVVAPTCHSDAMPPLFVVVGWRCHSWGRLTGGHCAREVHEKPVGHQRRIEFADIDSTNPVIRAFRYLANS